MQENDFFTWRRAMLLRFQEMAAAEDVYTELQYQTQRLEFDYYALCVRHPVPFTRPKISLRTTYPQAWVTHYQSENYFAIDPVLKPENFRQGHLHWDDVLFYSAANYLIQICILFDTTGIQTTANYLIPNSPSFDSF